MDILQNFVIRLKPGQDLRKELLELSRDQDLRASVVVSGVGSLTQANIRFAGAETGQKISGPLEIVSLTGTLGNGRCHLHISVADRDGRVTGGHLLDESIVHTTVELSLLENKGLEFLRERDPQTGFDELKIWPRVR